MSLSSLRNCVASICLSLLVAASLTACHKSPDATAAPLPAELAAVHCPAERNGHASTMIGKAEVTFVCVDQKQASNPSLMRCDRETQPNQCADAGEILLSHDGDGLVYSETVPNYAAERDNHGPASGPTDDSQLHIIFHAGPPQRATFDPVESAYSFVLPGVQDMIPSGFTFVKGTLCDREATVLDTGICNFELTTPSLYWHIAISIHHPRGTPINDHEYRTEIAFWLKYLAQMVTDPKVAGT